MSRLKKLIHEIHRRSIWQVLGIYAVASWIIYQIVLALFEGLGLPDWVPGTALVLLLIGLPIVLATAFVQEGPGSAGRSSEPEASPVERDEDEVGPETSTVPPASDKPTGGGGIREVFTWRRTLVGGILAFALWGLLAAGWVLLPEAPEERSPASMAGEDGGRTAVAVLPFENMSASEENAYFADGIHEDILTHLSRLEDLTVLSRASVLRYRDTEKRPGDIAAELGAHAVLEGSVRRVGKDVRIVVQLIDPNTEGQLWADTYDRTLHDVFQVQTEVARQVARSLEATLSPQEAERISKRPTESLAAYDLYLQVRAALERSDPEQNESAIWLFREALEDDAQFALARAGLSRAFVQRIRFGQPRIWVDSAVAAAHRAIEMDPEAAGYARDSLNLAPDNELFFWHYTETLLGLSLLLSGDTEECRRVLRTAMEEDRRRLQEGAVRAVPWDLAAAHAALGQEDAAVDRLEQAYENGFRHPQWLKIDPAFDGIRDDVRFRRIMERLEADLAEMRERVQEQFPHRG